MLMRVTRRLKAGRLLAVIYLICVLAPSASSAFGAAGSSTCLMQDAYGMGVAHVHDQTARIVQSSREDGHAHGSSGPVHSDPIHTGHVQSEHSDDHDDLTTAGAEASSSAGDQHKSTGVGHCCGMVCVSALPATVAEIIQPSIVSSLCASANYQNVADKAPARLYRPPIT